LEYTGTHHMPFDGRVGSDEFLDQTDVGPHLDAEAFLDREVPVVAGRRAQKLDRRLAGPRP
jgi:hypothetical protein